MQYKYCRLCATRKNNGGWQLHWVWDWLQVSASTSSLFIAMRLHRSPDARQPVSIWLRLSALKESLMYNCRHFFQLLKTDRRPTLDAPKTLYLKRSFQRQQTVDWLQTVAVMLVVRWCPATLPSLTAALVIIVCVWLLGWFCEVAQN